MSSESQRYYTTLLALLLLACIVRFWLFLLPESFWLDETVTAFVLRHGAGHASLAAGPRLDQTLYYWLPRISRDLFGFSEFSLRLPSFVVTLVSLFLIGRLAARLIHPQAGWFAIFLCFIPHEFTRQATDARPYGLGTCVALAAMWFLVRWLDRNDWRDAALFAIFAALLVRIHLIYWPFYGVFVIYALVRGIRRETPVSGRAMGAVFAVVAAAIAPLIPLTLGLFREAKIHVVTEMPTLRNIVGGLQIVMIAAAGAGAWLIAKLFRCKRESLTISVSGIALLIAWWLWQPACLLAASWMTGNAVFLPRYFSLAIPGMILMGTLAAGYSIPDRAWKPVAAALAAGILIAGFWKPFPPTRNSHWREAARAVNDLVGKSDIPVLCPSPFIEGQPPIWTSSYALPGFLYAHLDVYPVRGTKVLLPARLDPEGEQYVKRLIEDSMLRAGRFVVYGGTYGVGLWDSWLARQAKLAGWRERPVGSFGDAEAVLFETPGGGR